jgi:hypothetical protein
MTSWLNWTVSERFGRLQLLELIHSIGWVMSLHILPA